MPQCAITAHTNTSWATGLAGLRERSVARTRQPLGKAYEAEPAERTGSLPTYRRGAGRGCVRRVGLGTSRRRCVDRAFVLWRRRATESRRVVLVGVVASERAGDGQRPPLSRAREGFARQ
jgi:hypothetical protein